MSSQHPASSGVYPQNFGSGAPLNAANIPLGDKFEKMCVLKGPLRAHKGQMERHVFQAETF